MTDDLVMRAAWYRAERDAERRKKRWKYVAAAIAVAIALVPFWWTR